MAHGGQFLTVDINIENVEIPTRSEANTFVTSIHIFLLCKS